MLWVALLSMREKAPEWASEKDYLRKKKKTLKTVALVCLVVGIVGWWLSGYIAQWACCTNY
jgi:predicted alpha/beta hydrolase